jgi:hypothetical protein
MTKLKTSRTVKMFAAILMCTGFGVAEANTTNLGTVTPGSYSFSDVISFGQTFTDFVNFKLTDSADITSFIKSFDLSILQFDLLGIDHFSASLQRAGQGGFQTLVSQTSNPISFDDLLTPGNYRLALSGTGSGFLGGVYRGTLQVAAVPEADTWVMLLVGFGIVLYQLRRKQRSLDLKQPQLA